MTDMNQLDDSSPTAEWLKKFIEAEGGSSGTVHKRVGDLLVLTGAHNIPPPVLKLIATIPKGKGMAGLAWERSKPVSTCNLKTDTTGDVRPGAKAVNAQAAVAFPIGVVEGDPAFIVGIAYKDEKELSEKEHQHLHDKAESLLSIE